jgi:hypothetical protein
MSHDNGDQIEQCPFNQTKNQYIISEYIIANMQLIFII